MSSRGFHRLPDSRLDIFTRLPGTALSTQPRGQGGVKRSYPLDPKMPELVRLWAGILEMSEASNRAGGKGRQDRPPPPPHPRPQSPSDSTCSHEPHHYSLSEEQRVGNSRLRVHGPNNFTGSISRPILGPPPPPPPELTWWPSRAMITSAEDREIQEKEPELISTYKQLPAKEEEDEGRRKDRTALGCRRPSPRQVPSAEYPVSSVDRTVLGVFKEKQLNLHNLISRALPRPIPEESRW